MPNRIIRESCRSSPTLDTLSAEAERLFWRLTTVADDHGRFEADPRLLLAACFPLAVDRIKAATVAKWFAELVASDAVVAYVVENRSYGAFRSWGKHQRVRESKPKYPEPLDAPAAIGGASPQVAASCGLARALDHDSGLGSRGGEEREKRGAPPRSPRELTDAFEARFWPAYPKRHGRRDGKSEALTAWLRLAPDLELEARMLRALASYGKATEYPVDAVRWLKHRRWEDEPDAARPATPVVTPIDLSPRIRALVERQEVARG